MAPTEEIERPRRLSLSAIVEMLLARGTADSSYVALTRNAKGETQLEVKVRTGEHGDVQTVEDAERRAVEVYDRLVQLYAPPESREQTTVELTRNAKGETQIEVQVRSGEHGDVQTAEQTADHARDTYDRLRSRYPMSDGNTAKPGSVRSA